MTIAYSNHYFTIEHCDDCFISGHLIIRPKEQVDSIIHLEKEALAMLGNTLALAYAIIDQVIKPERIYTLSFCEVLPVLHFHVFPRSESLTWEYNRAHSIKNSPINGALFFDWSRKHSKKQDNYAILQEAINSAFKSKFL